MKVGNTRWWRLIYFILIHVRVQIIEYLIVLLQHLHKILLLDIGTLRNKIVTLLNNVTFP